MYKLDASYLAFERVVDINDGLHFDYFRVLEVPQSFENLSHLTLSATIKISFQELQKILITESKDIFGGNWIIQNYFHGDISL